MTSSTFSRCAISARRSPGRKQSCDSKLVCAWQCRPISRFCNTEALTNSSIFWKVRAMPSPAIRCGGVYLETHVVHGTDAAETDSDAFGLEEAHRSCSVFM